ncbi:hypothetical protein HJC99_05455 [Candidatus Saccharibacteria bacterium]|nr:hypothetical protein [Candidatus Saccharibacteria bacterium]
MKFSGTMVGSDNPKALGEFYTKILGKPGMQEDTWYGWQDGAQIMIGGHSEVTGQNTAPARIMLTLEVEDVPASYNELIKLGATSIAEPYHPSPDNPMWLATVADPDGNYLQVAAPWN